MADSSHCRTYDKGRHKVVILSDSDAADNKPSPEELLRLDLIPEDEEEYGVIKPNGDINWSCPCLGNMATGPCAVPFRTAFSCFHYSSAEPRGSDCYEEFAEMQVCMARFPRLYPKDDDDDRQKKASNPFPGQTSTSSAYTSSEAGGADGDSEKNNSATTTSQIKSRSPVDSDDEDDAGDDSVTAPPEPRARNEQE